MELLERFGEPIKGVYNFGGRIIVTTEKEVWEVTEGELGNREEIKEKLFSFISKSKWLDNDGNLKTMGMANMHKWQMICQDLADLICKKEE